MYAERETHRAGPTAAGALSVLGLVFASGCVTVPPEEDPVLIKLSQIETRLTKLEQSMENESLLEVVNQLQGMEQDVRELRGEVETIDNEVEGVRERQRDLFVQLDQRVARMEQGSAGASPLGATGVPLAVPGGAQAPTAAPAAGNVPAVAVAAPAATRTDADIYQAAFDLLKEGRYPEAGAGFQELLTTAPDSALAANSQYWYAETLYVTQSFAEAKPQFEIVVQDYPRSSKVPDAQLKIGYCHYELKEWDQARAVLEALVERYGDSTAARFAKQRLDKMTREGR